jgi:hypothetical protein
VQHLKQRHLMCANGSYKLADELLAAEFFGT